MKKYFIIPAIILLLFSCKKSELMDSPHWSVVGDAVASSSCPYWSVQTTDEPNSMTICLAAPVGVEYDVMDTIAVFCGNECVGKSTPTLLSSTMALVYVYQPKGDGSSLQLRWYSHSGGCVWFTSPNAEQYKTDECIGSVNAPEVYSWYPYGSLSYNAMITVVVPWDRSWLSADEAAVFVGDECRGVLSGYDQMDVNHLMMYIPVAMRDTVEQMSLRVYDSERRMLSFERDLLSVPSGRVSFFQ